MGNDSDRVFEMSDGRLREMTAKERKKHSLMALESETGGGGGGGEKEEFVPPKGEGDTDEESSISPSSSSVYLRYFLSPGAACSIPPLMLFLASLLTLQAAAVGSDLWLAYWYGEITL